MGGDQDGWGSLNEVLKVSRHSGVAKLTRVGSLTYLGVDIGVGDKLYIYISQESSIGAKLPIPDLQKFYVAPTKLTHIPRRLTECRRVVGDLILILQTRSDITHKLCSLSSEVVEVVLEDKRLPIGCATQ